MAVKVGINGFGRIGRLVFLVQGLAVRITAVIDPACDVATDISVNHVVLVQREQEGMAVVIVFCVQLVHLLMRHEAALVVNQFHTGRYILPGKYTIAVNGRTTKNDQV